MVGEISIEPEYDLVLHHNNGKVEVYPAHKIHAVYFYDGDANINRKFISMKQTDIFSRHQLYEIVLRGEVCVYRTKKLWTENSPSDADGYNYFVFHHEQLIDIQKFRKSVYPYLLESAGSMLAVFMDENKLNPNSAANVITIIHFYNSLKKEDQLLAKH